MRTALICFVLCAAAADLPAARRAPQIPETYTNLQILPKDITRQNLVPIMRSFALNLGVRCEQCHVGEGNDLSKFDFASDQKPDKAIARRMMKLLETVNGDLLKGIGDPARLPKVTCYTCHRGMKTPATAAAAGGGADRL